MQYAKSLARIDSYSEVAREQFQLALKQKESTETRLLYADHLAKKAAYRDEALSNYRRVMAQRPKDLSVRFKHARLLGAVKADTPKAISAYQEILHQDPKNSTAHREMGRAYAWQGDNDRAIHHANLALRYDREDRTARRLRGDLMEGREPRVWSGMAYAHQGADDDNYAYDGYRVFVAGQMDVIPFLTAGMEAGREHYDGDTEPDGAEANVYQLSLQYRLDPEHRVDTHLRYYDFKDAGNDAAFLLQYTFPGRRWWISPGFRRELRYDSLLALREYSDPATGDTIGGVRSNIAFCKLFYEDNRFKFYFTPYAGFMTAEGIDDNLVGGADLDARLTLMEQGSFILGTNYGLKLAHYDEDQSGFSADEEMPAGGYYGPDFYMDNTLAADLIFNLDPGRERQLRISAGPSFQYSQGHDGEAGWETGGALKADFRTRISANLMLKLEAHHHQVADLYQHTGVGIQVAYAFQ